MAATAVLQRAASPLPASPKMPDAPRPSPPSDPRSNPDVFTFAAGPLPRALPLHFSFPAASPPARPLFTFVAAAADASKHATTGSRPRDNPLKRRRRLTDVDGDLTSALLRKKRRLRLDFVTSRLSRPFSHPATNIVDRGGSKAAMWALRLRNASRRAAIAAAAAAGINPNSGFLSAGFKAGARCVPSGAVVGGGAGMQEPMLRKAAILNRMRLRGLRRGGAAVLTDAEAGPLKSQLRSAEPEAAPATVDEPFVETPNSAAPEAVALEEEQQQQQQQRMQSPNMLAAGKMPYSPLLPSPLGMTNYDALDLEDGFLDDDDGSVDDDDGSREVVGGAAAALRRRSVEERRDSFYSDFSVFDDPAAADGDEEGDGEDFSWI